MLTYCISSNIDNPQITLLVKFRLIALYGGSIYRVAQKSKPLPNYQKIVLNRIKASQ